MYFCTFNFCRIDSDRFILNSMENNQQKKKAKSTSKKKSPARKFFKILGIIILAFFVLSIVKTVLFRWVNPPITPLMVIRKVQYGGPIEYEWRDLKDISPNMVQCAVSSEDNRFLGHPGFDGAAIDRAIEERKTRGRRRGASTISQQTAKNVFLWPRSSWVRKGFEVYYTFLIEQIWGKERIMEVYLNVIEMGPGIYGAEAAAQHYYHTSASHLTMRQAALITACYPDPLHRNPTKVTRYLNRRAGQIIKNSYCIGKVRFDDKALEAARERYKNSEAKRKERKEREKERQSKRK